ncbi:MAG: HNH endonuclease [Candidatus Parcubacteria bacterium]|nr:HNH endonuclease [Candidatus Parcubacteria bacterium]
MESLDLPFSKGGTSLTTKNIRLLCAKCNLAKSDKIE